jgi:hypothetical protein
LHKLGKIKADASVLGPEIAGEIENAQEMMKEESCL